MYSVTHDIKVKIIKIELKHRGIYDKAVSYHKKRLSSAGIKQNREPAQNYR